MIPAVIAACLIAAPAQCERHDIRVEPRACRIAPIHGEAPINGEWKPVTVRILCAGR